MASAMALKLSCVVLLCMIVGAPVATAITCGQVSSNLAPCIAYLRGNTVLPPACCSGVRSLNSAATTTPDRQAVCSCLKGIATSIRGIDYNKAAALPGQCRVSVPYKISPNTDCSKVT